LGGAHRSGLLPVVGHAGQREALRTRPTSELRVRTDRDCVGTVAHGVPIPLSQVSGKWSESVVELGKQKRVLIVDDERVITDTLVTIFSQGGYESKGVYSAEQALIAMEDWSPALVIIDVMLPAMNGIDLAIRIKSQLPECHLSLFSGQAATSDLLEMATRNGYRFDVVAKPVHPSELLGMAGRLLHEGPGSISENN
jgi:CheY-like chemotaxis protein